MPKAGGDSKADYQKYKKYYIDRQTSEAGKDKRVEQDRARTKAIKAGVLKGPQDPRTVDHIRPLSKGGGNAKSNLRAMSATANRRKYNNT